MAPREQVQGTMVEIMGVGVLIEGKPGMGKSETALELIRKGCALVSDDVTMLRRDSAGSLIGSPASITRYHMEIRGLGIIHVPSLFGVASVRGEKKLDIFAEKNLSVWKILAILLLYSLFSLLPMFFLSYSLASRFYYW